MNRKNIFKKLINPKNNDVHVIAEMSGNHKNSLTAAKKFVIAANKNGADIIKFQVYKPETITFKSNNKDFLVEKKGGWKKYKYLYELYNKAYTPWKWIEELAKLCNSLNQEWFASPFDETAVDFLEKLKCKAYKLASPEITDIGLIEKISKTKKPIIISTGLAQKKDIDLALATVKKFHKNFAILQCTSSYPCPNNETNLLSIPMLKKEYKCSIGFSDHTIGFNAPRTAVALGATIIEKHFKLDNDNKSIDSRFSTNINDLKSLKKDFKNIKENMGISTYDISNSALNGISGRRSLYAIKDIKKGEKLTLKNIKSIRPHYGLHPKYLKKIINKKATKNIKAGTRLEKKLIKGI